MQQFECLSDWFIVAIFCGLILNISWEIITSGIYCSGDYIFRSWEAANSCVYVCECWPSLIPPSSDKHFCNTSSFENNNQKVRVFLNMDPTLSMDPSGLTRTPPKDLLSMGNVDGQLGGTAAQNPQVIMRFTRPEANEKCWPLWVNNVYGRVLWCCGYVACTQHEVED